MRLLSRQTLVLAVALIGSLGAAVAIATPYVALRGSLAFADDMKSRLAGTSLRTSLDTGWTGSIAFGDESEWLGVKLELEGLYGKFTPSKLKSGATTTKISGDVDVAAPMINAIYEIPLNRMWPDLLVKPFIGAGLGGVYVSVDPHGTALPIAQDDQWGWGYQLMAGFAVPLSDSTDLSFQYRYLEAPNVRLHGTSGASYKTDLAMSSIGMGLEFRF
jgi:opacity protein-like surface antigen